MRLNLGSLDPNSPLARRIREALARDVSSRVSRLATSGAERGLVESEEQLQRSVVSWLATLVPDVLAFHPANGGRRGKAEAGRLKAMGVLGGVPDLVILARGRVLGLELKSARGTLSPTQEALAERWRAAGAPYHVARSLPEVQSIVDAWLFEESHSDAAVRSGVSLLAVAGEAGHR